MSRIAVFLLGCLAIIATGLSVIGAAQPTGAAAVVVPTHTPLPTRVVLTPTRGPSTPTAVPVASPTAVPMASPTPSAGAELVDPPELRGVWVDAFHDGFKT